MGDRQVPEWVEERTNQRGDPSAQDGRGPAEQQRVVQDGLHGQPGPQRPVVLVILMPVEAGALQQMTQPQQRPCDGSEMGQRRAS